MSQEEEYKTQVTFVLCVGKSASSALALMSNCRSVMSMHDEETLASSLAMGSFNFIDWAISRAKRLDQHLLICSTLAAPTLKVLLSNDPDYFSSLTGDDDSVEVNIVYLSADADLIQESYKKVGLDISREQLDVMSDECYSIFRDSIINGRKMKLSLREKSGESLARSLEEFADIVGIDEYNKSRLATIFPLYRVGMTPDAIKSSATRLVEEARKTEKMLEETEQQ